MPSSLLSFAVPAPQRAQRDGTFNSDDRRAWRIGAAPPSHRHAISARGVVQGGGPDKLFGKKCLSNRCKKVEFDTRTRTGTERPIFQHDREQMKNLLG